MSTTKMAGEPTLQQRLIQRATLGWTLAEQERIDEIGYDDYLEEQLDYLSIDNSEIEDVIAERFPDLSRSAHDLFFQYFNRPEEISRQLLTATLLRAIHSRRQLYERMVVFWSDHFSIDLFANNGFHLKTVDDREVVRRHAMGRFRDLLHASAHSPAMLNYLTNNDNIKGRPNENYPRELMELHTLGADNGYTQKDVVEVARCFTGWGTFLFAAGNQKVGTFRFFEGRHDTADKVFLGQPIPGSTDTTDGEAVLDILASHPNTAHFVASKLVRYLWGYEPPKNLVAKVAETYLRTDGNIRSMLRVVLRKAWMQRATPKLKRPFHMVASTLRALGSEISDASPALLALEAAGHTSFSWKPPNGFPDSIGYWSGYLLPRWDHVPRLIEPGSGLGVDLSEIDPVSNPSLTRDQVRGWLASRLFGGALSRNTKVVLRDVLADGPLDGERTREATILALLSPEFQMY